VLNPELWLVMQPLDPTDISLSGSISYPYQSLNTLTLQMGTALLQRINYLLQNSIIDTFTLMVNYKPTLLNLSFGKYLASSLSVQNLSLLFNGVVQLFNYDTTGLPLAVQLFPHIPNALVLAASKPGDSQINFEALANANFIPSKIAAEGTGKVFIDTQIGLLLQLKQITQPQATFPFFPPIWKSKLHYTLDPDLATHSLYSDNSRNAISAGPDWRARFCLLQGKYAFQTSAAYISLVTNGTSLPSLRDTSFPAYNTPSCQFIGALEPDQNFNTIIITRNYYTLTITPSASLITAEASVPDVLPDYLRFNQLANQSPIAYMRSEIIPLIVVANPPPGVITLRLIPPLSGFFSTGYLQLKFVLKCREPPCGYGWIQLFGTECAYLKHKGYPAMFPTLSSFRKYVPYMTVGAGWSAATGATVYGSPLMAAGYGLDTESKVALTDQKTPEAQCRAFVPFDCNQGLFNKIGLVNPYSILRSIRLEFPTGVSALFDNLAENFYLKTYGKPDVFVSASDTVFRNNRFVKSTTSNTLIDKFDRQRHHVYSNELSLLPFHFPNSAYPNMSDLASYDNATLILKVKAECLNFLAEAPFVNSKLYIDFNIDKRNVNLGFVSGGLGSGLVEGDLTNYLLGPSPPRDPTSDTIRMLGYPSQFDFDWELGPDPSFLMNLVYYPPTVQERAMDTFNTTGITASFSDFERHDRMAVSRSVMNYQGPQMNAFYDHINSNTLLSIGGRNIHSARVLHRYLRQDANNQFTVRLDDEVPSSLQYVNTIVAPTTIQTSQVSEFYPYPPKESVQLPKDDMRTILAATWNTGAPRTLKGPTLIFGQRLFIPSYIAPHIGPLCYSFPYAVTPRLDVNGYAQNPGTATFQVTADGVPMFGDILVGSSLVNSIMYSFNNNGSTLYGLPEQLQYGVPRSIEYYPKCPTFDCVAFNRQVDNVDQLAYDTQANGAFPQALARKFQPFNPVNHYWIGKEAETLVGVVPLATFGSKKGVIGRPYHCWSYGKSLLPCHYVTEISFPDDFLNTQLFSLPSLNCPQKIGPYSNWLTGYTFPNIDKSIATALTSNTATFKQLNVSFPTAIALFFPELMTDASFLCRTYFFNWSYSLTYRRTSAELKQHYPQGYSLNA
jgi:hypothetical protein